MTERDDSLKYPLEYKDLISFKIRGEEALNAIKMLQEAKLQLKQKEMESGYKSALGEAISKAISGGLNYENIDNISKLYLGFSFIPGGEEYAKALDAIQKTILAQKQISLEEDKIKGMKTPDNIYEYIMQLYEGDTEKQREYLNKIIANMGSVQPSYFDRKEYEDRNKYLQYINILRNQVNAFKNNLNEGSVGYFLRNIYKGEIPTDEQGMVNYESIISNLIDPNKQREKFMQYSANLKAALEIKRFYDNAVGLASSIRETFPEDLKLEKIFSLGQEPVGGSKNDNNIVPQSGQRNRIDIISPPQKQNKQEREKEKEEQKSVITAPNQPPSRKKKIKEIF